LSESATEIFAFLKVLHIQQFLVRCFGDYFGYPGICGRFYRFAGGAATFWVTAPRMLLLI